MAGKEEFEVARKAFEKDSRIACKYGEKCYQKNPAHHTTYKHPPKRKIEDHNTPSKKQKMLNVEGDRGGGKSPVKTARSSPCKEASKVLSKETEKKVLTIPEEEDDIPSSPENEKESIKQKFLVDMPEDFYSFWSYCKSLSPEKPEDALKDACLHLVGPYDVMSGKLKAVKHHKLSLYLVHWRYYFDPPEFQTVIKGDDSKQYHMGYYRDDPQEAPCFVASSAAAVDCTITPMAENIFGAVNLYLDTMKEKADPFRKIKLSKLQSSLQSWAKEHDFNLEKSTAGMKARNRKVVSKTFHKAGIVVPVNKNDLGYRELYDNEANLKKILKNIKESTTEGERDIFFGKLQPIVTATDIATDECDFGTGLELGIDLFCFGGEVFHRTALRLLKTAYGLLGRNEFAQIAEAHIQNRRTGSALSIIE